MSRDGKRPAPCRRRTQPTRLEEPWRAFTTVEQVDAELASAVRRAHAGRVLTFRDLRRAQKATQKAIQQAYLWMLVQMRTDGPRH